MVNNSSQSQNIQGVQSNITGTGITANIVPSVVVYGQTITSNSILVARVTIDTPGWVVIHNNLNGHSSNISNTGVIQLGSGTTETGPLAININSTAGSVGTTEADVS
ncbi:MAG: hypothetical protein WB392_06875 [Methanotrichaceae archaeon]